MATLKLARLPDRVPVKMTLSLPPELHSALSDYATLYSETYGEKAKVEDLVPAMLASFLDSDREFAKSQRSANSPSAPT
ncbi:DUF2274 domain-containing protein [soil metagenome]